MRTQRASSPIIRSLQEVLATLRALYFLINLGEILKFHIKSANVLIESPLIKMWKENLIIYDFVVFFP